MLKYTRWIASSAPMLSSAPLRICDSGRCTDLTSAVVLGVEGLWLSMCLSHASKELEFLTGLEKA